MRRIAIAFAMQWISFSVFGLGAVLDGEIPLRIYPTAPAAVDATSRGGAGDYASSARDTVQVLSTPTDPRLTLMTDLLRQLPPGAGLDLPGITLADEYGDELVDYDPQSEKPPKLLNPGGCWVNNLQELTRIQVFSGAVETLPSSSNISLRITCTQASKVRLIPQQAGQEVRVWSASLVGGAPVQRTGIEIIAEEMSNYRPLVDGQFQTIAKGDGLHRVNIDFRVVAYEGSELAPRYPKQGGEIAVQDISLEIRSSPIQQ